MTNKTYQQVDVIIVGAGPIGLSMCQALAGTGLKIALIERQSRKAIQNPAFDGREIAITHRTKAIMQDLHQWQQINPENIHHLKRAKVYNGTSDFALGFDKPDFVHGRAVETLGYLIGNNHIRKAAYDSLNPALDKPNITTFFDSQITHAKTNALHAQVELVGGTVVRAKLIIAADSRMSFVRKVLGIGADMHDFGRTVMVFRTKHTKSNEQTAHEGFYYGKTLAVLPLGEYQSSMVVTIDNAKVDAIKSLSKKQLAGEMMMWLNNRLGDMTVVSDIHDYPLIGVHARSFYGERVALIGDAAVGMHPVTAHGYNLGMESVAILARLMALAVNDGKDIADTALLRHYSHTHMAKTRAMYHGTNAIVKLYTSETPPARFVRHVGLRVSNQLLPIKKLITNQLTG